MSQGSRAKRKRAAVRSAKRSKQNNWWYGLTALVVILGVVLIVVTQMNEKPEVGPYVGDQVNTSNPHNKDSHWHAALGVYNCDHWMGDGTGEGVWKWPAQTPQGNPARANNTNVYAGMHSHEDGIIHMEPAVNEEAGRHATVGKYFEFGGWHLSASSIDFLGTKVKNGDKCGTATGTWQWGVGRYNAKTGKVDDMTVKSGDPAGWKLSNDDVVVLAFLPPGKTIASLGPPPSAAKLPDAASAQNTGTTTPSLRPTTPPTSVTPTTKKP